MLGSVLKQEKISPTNPLSITWYIACVRRSDKKKKKSGYHKKKFPQTLNGFKKQYGSKGKNDQDF